VLIADTEDPVLLRAIIAQANVFIGCRFHSVVAALSCGVPTLTIGWSHKYSEMAEQLDAGSWVLDTVEFEPEEGYRMVRSLLDRAEDLRVALRGHIERVRLDSARNFERAAGVIGWAPR
jgi:polysaccharide pyruvyl transferase WcaK-like protein